MIRAAIHAREIARRLGKWMRVEFLWAQRALRLRFIDESALVLSRRGAVLEGTAGIANDAHAFAQAHAENRKWLFLPKCPEWPFSYRGRPGDSLSAPADEMPRLRAEVLRAADIKQLPDSQFPRPQLLAALDGLHSEDASEPAAPRFVSTGSRKRFVVVTRRCTSSDDPRLIDKIIWLEERQRQEPGMQILFLHAENGTLKQIRLDQVLHILRSLAKRRDAARPSDLDGTGRQLEGLPAVDSSTEPDGSEDDYGPGF